MNTEEIKTAHTRTVDSLERVYAILIGLALSTAVGLLLQAHGIIVPANPAQVGDQRHIATDLVFVAFVSTLVVFYHGMNRHLDDTFVIGPGTNRSRLLLLTDIFVFLGEGAVLVAMGSTINNATVFLKAWTVLLIVDVVWGLFVYVVAGKPPFRWIINNCAFLVLTWILWLWMAPGNAFFIAVFEIARSIFDYKLNWKFYFPKDPSAQRHRSLLFD